MVEVHIGKGAKLLHMMEVKRYNGFKVRRFMWESAASDRFMVGEFHVGKDDEIQFNTGWLVVTNERLAALEQYNGGRIDT